MVTALERRYADIDGLNLTLGDPRRAGQAQRPAGRCGRAGRPGAMPRGSPLRDPRLQRQPGSGAATPRRPEAQAAAISDDIAYDCHDMEDGLRAGLFASPTSRAGRWLRRSSAAIHAPLSRPRRGRGDPRAGPAASSPADQGRARRERRRVRGAGCGERRGRAQRGAPLVAFSAGVAEAEAAP